jgi:ABC-2 type transport system permease protein
MIATLKSKSFVISNVVILVCVFAGFFVSGLVSGLAGGPGGSGSVAGAPERVAVAPEVVEVARELPDVEVVPVRDVAAAFAMVEAGDVEVALVGTPSSPRLVGDESVPDNLVDALTHVPDVELLTPPRVEEVTRYFLSLAFGMVYMMMAMMYGQLIAQNTVVEKQTRIVEILLAAVPTRAMLAGKIIGGAILAVGDMVLIAAVCLAGMEFNGMTKWLAIIQGPMWWYVAFFLVGFVMYAAFFTAAGALVSRIEDLSGAATPIMLLVMAPYFLVISLNGSATAMTVLSYVPFTSPVAMPVQMVLGDAGPLGALASLAILAATAVLLGAAAARIYNNSVLRIGARVRVRQALRGREGS